MDRAGGAFHLTAGKRGDWRLGDAGGRLGQPYLQSGLAPGHGKLHSAGMATRDRFEIALACSKCGATGVAQASENDDPSRQHPDFRIDELPRGFTLVKRARNRHESKVACATCGKILTP